jgi:thiamine biosynthesis lipoprotein
MKFFLSQIVLLCLSAFCVTGCGSTKTPVTHREQMLMGTLVSISISNTDSEKANRSADLAFQEIRRIEQIMSTYLPESEISLINRSAGTDWQSVHPEILFVIQEALGYSRLSNGAFDITFKPLTRLWNFEPESRPPDPGAVRELLNLVDFKAVLIDKEDRVLLKKPGMAIGLGGIAKGYAVDRAMAVLEAQGITDAIINSGGDLRVIGRRTRKKRWRIGIQDPRNRDTVIETIDVSGGAVATSGDYEKYFIDQGIRYHHILNPKTGFPARGCRSVTVICPAAMMADAMATAVFVLGPEKGMELIRHLPDLEGMIVNNEGDIIKSEGFQQEQIK